MDLSFYSFYNDHKIIRYVGFYYSYPLVVGKIQLPRLYLSLPELLRDIDDS